MRKALAFGTILLVSALAGGCAAERADHFETIRTATVTEAATPDSRGADRSLTMPAVVGMRLQEAERALRSLGVNAIDQQDASGQGRTPTPEGDWTVCAQQPVPRTILSASYHVVLASVEATENCP